MEKTTNKPTPSEGGPGGPLRPACGCGHSGLTVSRARWESRAAVSGSTGDGHGAERGRGGLAGRRKRPPEEPVAALRSAGEEGASERQVRPQETAATLSRPWAKPQRLPVDVFRFRIPSTVCFGQGASRGFKSTKKRSKRQ